MPHRRPHLLRRHGHPGSPMAETPARRNTPWQTFGPTVLAGLVGAGLAAVAAGRDWATTLVTSGVRATAAVKGSTSAPLAIALALVALAAWGVVLVLVRGRLRRLVALVGALASAGVVVTALASLDRVKADAARAVEAKGVVSAAAFGRVGERLVRRLRRRRGRRRRGVRGGGGEGAGVARDGQPVRRARGPRRGRVHMSGMWTGASARAAGASYRLPIAGHPGAFATATANATAATTAATTQVTYQPLTDASDAAALTTPLASTARAASAFTRSREASAVTTTPAEASAPTSATRRRSRPRTTSTTPHAARATRARAMASGAEVDPFTAAVARTPEVTEAVAQSRPAATAARPAPTSPASTVGPKLPRRRRSGRSGVSAIGERQLGGVEAGAVAGVAGGTDLVDLDQQGVAVAVEPDLATSWRWPEVSPLTQYSWRDRLQNVVRPVVRVRCSASSSIQPSIRTSPVSCCCTTAGDETLAVALEARGDVRSRGRSWLPVSGRHQRSAHRLLRDPGWRAAGRRRRPRRPARRAGRAATTRPLSTTSTSSAPSAVDSRCAIATVVRPVVTAPARGRAAPRSPGRPRWSPRRAPAGRGRRRTRGAARRAAAPPPTATRRAARPGCRARAAARRASRRRPSSVERRQRCRRRSRRAGRSGRCRRSVASNRNPSCGTITTRVAQRGERHLAQVHAGEPAPRPSSGPSAGSAAWRTSSCPSRSRRRPRPGCSARSRRSTSCSTGGPPG